MAVIDENTEILIAADGLGKVFRDFWRKPKVRAVNKISFKVKRGEVFGLLGPNGSGKSTVIKMILGLLYPSYGKLTVLNTSPTDVKSKKSIGYLPEESYIYPYLTPIEILHFYGSLFGLDKRARSERVEQLLDMSGLQHVAGRPVGEFSKGMARRLGLAQALINDPDLVILDEPTSGLDPIGRRQIKDLITALAQRGKTVLLSSHLLAEVEDVCNRVAILFNGNIIVQGDINELLEKTDAYRLTFNAANPETARKAFEAVQQAAAVTPEIDHPKRTLERFFLDAVNRAGQDSGYSSGAVQSGKIAEFLSGPGK